MLDGMTAAQMAEWVAYHEMDPIGQERGDLQAAIVAATVANSVRHKGRAAKPSDFMPRWRPRRRQTTEEMNSILLAAMAAARGAQ